MPSRVTIPNAALFACIRCSRHREPRYTELRTVARRDRSLQTRRRQSVAWLAVAALVYITPHGGPLRQGEGGGCAPGSDKLRGLAEVETQDTESANATGETVAEWAPTRRVPAYMPLGEKACVPVAMSRTMAAAQRPPYIIMSVSQKLRFWVQEKSSKASAAGNERTSWGPRRSSRDCS